MKKTIFTILILVFMVTLAEAKIYVCLDKTTGEARGTVDINEKAIGDWAKQFIMIESDEDYRGKKGFEIKFEGQKLRQATKKEIDDYNKTQADIVNEAQKKKALETLGLTEADITKIKAIP